MDKFYVPEKVKVAVFSVYFLCLFQIYNGHSQTPVLTFNPVISSGLVSPLDIVSAGDGTNRLFIVEQRGIIKYAKAGLLIDTVFLDIRTKVSYSAGGERGLLSLAFHPGYRTNGYFFVYYTDLAGNVTIERYHVSPDANLADPLSGKVILQIPHTEFGNHNGGKLNFGTDGNLYFATGDGGFAGDPHFNAQKGDNLLGKMIRINVDRFAVGTPLYDIPAGNPYAAGNDNIRDEIWAFGLRNPYRWSFDRLTHDLWIGDVGQGAREEIDYRPATNTGGINYGWRCYEGNLGYNDSGCLSSNNYVFPVFDYDRSNENGGTTVIGGIVYRGVQYPALYGWYVCIDLASTNGWMIKPNGSGGWIVQKQRGLPTLVAGFGEDENGELFATALNGVVYRIQASASGPLPVLLQSFNAVDRNGLHEITWTTTSEQNLRQFEVQSSIDGTNFQTISIVAATNTNAAKQYRFNYRAPNSEKIFYRVRIVNNDGSSDYSGIIERSARQEIGVTVTPTLVKDARLTIQFGKPYRYVQMIDMNGHVVQVKNFPEGPGIFNMDVSGLPKGIYIVRVVGNGSQVYRKVFLQ